jgi:capsular exopolysaccharide synthesis family protein
MTIGSPSDQAGFDQAQAAAIGIGPGDESAATVVSSRLQADPRILWSIFRRRFWIFLLVAAMIMGAVAAYLAVAPKHYSATASVLIEPRAADPILPSNSVSSELLPSSDYIDTQLVVINSPRMAAMVVTNLGLVDDPEFAGGAAFSPELSDAELRQARIVASAEALRRAVAIRRAGRTSVIEIEATSKSATQAARIANAFAQAYLDSIRAALDGVQKVSSGQINSRLDELRVDAERADAALQQYKIANGLMSAQGSTTAEQETSVLNQQLAGAKATLAERRGRLAAARRQVANGGDGSDVASTLNSGTIGALRSQEGESLRSLAQLQARYGTRHPAIEQEQQRLEAIQHQIQLQIDRIMSSLEAEVKVAESGVDSLLSSQRESRAKLAGDAAAQVGFLELERKATAARAIYQAFLNKSIGTAAREGINQPRASVDSPALIPLIPSDPNVRLIIALGSIFSLAFGVLAIALAEYLDNGIRTKVDVERRLGARYLGAVPEVGSTLPNMRRMEPAQDYIVSHPQSIFAEALRGLRASLTLRGRRRPKVIAIVSALPREGKTTTAICLARTLALSGARTVLVDCDIRRHSASDMLLGDSRGQLLDVLAGNLLLDKALVKDRDTDLAILGVSSSAEMAGDLLATDALVDLLGTLRGRFEYIVIDTPPVIGLADARVVASHADTVLFLARWRKTSLRTVDTALDMLIAANARIAGVALTLVDIRKYASTGHEDVYSYYGKFKGYYTN